MLPALPTGRQWTSGALPSASTISKDAVFCPSIRNGLIEFTTDTPSRSPSARTTSSAWSKFPRICTTCAPWINACASLPSAILPSGITTPQVMPARAAYAAALADVFPVDAQTTTFAPSSTALVMAIVMPAVLERAGGVRALDLEVDVEPELLGEARRRHQRRVALEQGDHRGACR